MMKCIKFFLLFMCLATVSFGQAKKGHKNYYKAVDPIEQDQYQFAYINMVSRYDYCKFGFKLKNKTDDYLLLRKGESEFDFSGEKQNTKEKEVLIRPHKIASGVFNANGAMSDYHVEGYTFQLNGVYLLPASGTVVDVPKFDLPARENKIEAGDFQINLKKLDKKTKETVVTFEVTYTGEDYALVDQSKLVVSVPDKGDQVFANNHGSTKVKVFTKGKTITIKAVFNIQARYADMQFANMVIDWKDCFQVSVPQKLEGGTTEFVLDPGLTDGKN